jgi:hypothetical protein
MAAAAYRCLRRRPCPKSRKWREQKAVGFPAFHAPIRQSTRGLLQRFMPRLRLNAGWLFSTERG